MLTIDAAQDMIDSNPGATFVIVKEDGHVRQGVFLSRVARMGGQDVLYFLIPDPAKAQSPDGPMGRVEAFWPLDEIAFSELDPKDWKQYFQIFTYEKGDTRIYCAQRKEGHSRAFSSSIPGAISKMRSHDYSNPSDCSCEYRHCSFRTCRSIVPSAGAIAEADRQFPVEAAPGPDSQ